MAGPPPGPGRLPGGRLELYGDAKPRRVETVVFYDSITPDLGGNNRFVRPRALVLDSAGGSIEEMIRSPLVEIRGETGNHRAADGTFDLSAVQSRFREVPVSGADPSLVSRGAVHIDSETLALDTRHCRGVYERNVQIRQEGSGALEATCQRLEVVWETGRKGLVSARALGSPVVFRFGEGNRAEVPELLLDFPSGRAVAPRGGTAVVRTNR